MKQSMSISHGTPGGHRHNVEEEYREGLSHVDESRTCLNEIVVDRDLGEMYHEIFDDAVKEYNAKQKRDDRKIGNYLEKIKSSKQEKPVYEMVVQIGNKDTNPATDEACRAGSSAIYRAFVKRLEKDFPNLKIQQAAIHMDEATPHLHVAYVPISTGNKRGLSIKNSLSGAYRQMGFDDVREANQRMFDALEETARTYGVDRLDVGCKRAHMSVRDFKAMAETIEREGEGKYQNDPALVKLLHEQQKQIDELMKTNEDALVCIDEIARATDHVRTGTYRETVREIGARCEEASKALHPRYEAVRGAVTSFRTAIREIPEWWRENIINPVTERLRASREHIKEKVNEVTHRPSLREVGAAMTRAADDMERRAERHSRNQVSR